MPRRLIHRRFGYRWVCACHETLVAEPGWPDVIRRAPGVVTHHWPDRRKSRGQYLGLLRLAVRERPTDGRMMHYLGRELLHSSKVQGPRSKAETDDLREEAMDVLREAVIFDPWAAQRA